MSSVRHSWPTLLRLAARNLQRNLRRTLITTAAISLGLAMIVVSANLNEGSYKRMMHSAISAQAGHIVVQAVGYTPLRWWRRPRRGSPRASWPRAAASRA
jgi:ABC-type lipoprotein release transport system permease subunit